MADTSLIEMVARDNGITLYRLYTTDQTADFLKKAPFTVKRWRSVRELRKRGGVPHPLRVTRVEGRIYYMGIDIVQFMIFRRDNPGVDDEPSTGPLAGPPGISPAAAAE